MASTQIEALAKDNDIKLVVLPGDSQPDPDLTSRSTFRCRTASACANIWWRAASSTPRSFFGYCRHLLEATEIPAPAEAPPSNGIYRSTTGKQMTWPDLLPLGA